MFANNNNTTQRIERRAVLKTVGGSIAFSALGSMPASATNGEPYSNVNFAEVGVVYNTPATESEVDRSPSHGGRLHVDPLSFYSIDRTTKSFYHLASDRMRQAFSEGSTIVRFDGLKQCR